MRIIPLSGLDTGRREDGAWIGDIWNGGIYR